MHRNDLLQYLDDLLKVREIQDYSLNGLQVEGRAEIRRIVLGVSACAELFQFAAQTRADAVLVHHGLFWQGQDPRLWGPLRERVRLLLQHDLNLFAYHLPLDKHPELGNNAVAARALGLRDWQPFLEVGIVGTCDGLSLEELLHRAEELYGPLSERALIVREGPGTIRKVAILAGGGGKYVPEAIRLGVDLFLTGEAAEPAWNLVREARMHLVALGHHATERVGVQALALHLAERLGLEAEFVDVPNPV
ncbi:MAG: Nif3-like dinuclear metal center hexameric protein [candidate division KSB1 bacterium]|nr:Nif3-like dinuclear metal center hexameric protein [candidate division KSB1 bacterium]